MYIPAQHIPLSKALAASKFPIDGKFMFFTNGASGIFAYRPFKDIAEVRAYYPLGSEFRKGSFEILVNTGGILSSDGSTITGGTNAVYWWRDGVADLDLVLKVGPSSVNPELIFTGVDLVSSNPYLVLSLSGSQRPTSVTVNGDTISGWTYYKLTNRLYGITADPTDEINVLVSGVPMAAPTLPVITQQPQSTEVVLFRTLTLTVVADNANSYQWYKNGAIIAGQTGSTLIYTNVNNSVAADYHVVVSNPAGTVTSNIATVTFDPGVSVINFSMLTRPPYASRIGRPVTVIDGGVELTASPGNTVYISSSATSIKIKQAGGDDLTLHNPAGVTEYLPIPGSNIETTFNGPFPAVGEVMEIFNDN